MTGEGKQNKVKVLVAFLTHLGQEKGSEIHHSLSEKKNMEQDPTFPEHELRTGRFANCYASMMSSNHDSSSAIMLISQGGISDCAGAQ